MQIGKQREVGTQESEFFSLWFFDLDDHLLAPCVSGSRHNRGSRGHIFGVADGCAFSSAFLNEYLNAKALKLAHAVWGEGDTAL